MITHSQKDWQGTRHRSKPRSNKQNTGRHPIAVAFPWPCYANSALRPANSRCLQYPPVEVWCTSDVRGSPSVPWSQLRNTWHPPYDKGKTSEKPWKYHRHLGNCAMSLCAIENLIVIFGSLLYSAMRTSCHLIAEYPDCFWSQSSCNFETSKPLSPQLAFQHHDGPIVSQINIEIPSKLPSWMPSVLAWTYRSHRAHGSFLRQNVLDIIVAPAHFQAIFLPIPPKSHRIWLDVAGSQSWATPEPMSCSYQFAHQWSTKNHLPQTKTTEPRPRTWSPKGEKIEESQWVSWWLKKTKQKA